MSGTVDDVVAALAALASAEGRFREERTLIVARERLPEALAAASSSGLFMLTDLTAVDRYPDEPRFELVYLLTALEPPARVRLKVPVPGGDPVAPSAVPYWSGAAWLEREVYDLFGIRFAGHPDLRRILMPDDWEGHPLRKDYPLVEEPVEFVGHTPKVPSAIIPKTPPRPR